MTSLDDRPALASELLAHGRDAEFVLLCVPDVHGSLRGKALRPAAFREALASGIALTDLVLALDPVDAPITDLTGFGVTAGAGDLTVWPLPETLHELAWQPGWQVCLGRPHWASGEVCAISPREVLSAVLARYTDLGYRVFSAFEYEVRIRSADGTPRSSGISYGAMELQALRALAERLAPALDGLGITLAAVHTEAAPGLLELNVAPGWGIDAADGAALLKFAVKEVAASLGLTASFLAKPTAGEEGSSGHIHLSLWDDEGNAFAGSRQELSGPLAGAVAGIVEHLPAASLALNPTINSYKRLVPGFFAPVNASWGLDNRSTAVRVIHSPRAERCRIECRRPGADANPYLALAALLVAAEDGIAREAVPPPPVVGDAYARADLPQLPASLEAALTAFGRDDVLRRGLGTEFSDYFATTRAWELRAWQQVVSEWERLRYERAV